MGPQNIKTSCNLHWGGRNGLISPPKTAISFLMMTDETDIPDDIAALARARSKAAIAALAEIMTCADAPAGVRVSAARALLDLGWGEERCAKRASRSSGPAKATN